MGTVVEFSAQIVHECKQRSTAGLTLSIFYSENLSVHDFVCFDSPFASKLQKCMHKSQRAHVS